MGITENGLINLINTVIKEDEHFNYDIDDEIIDIEDESPEYEEEPDLSYREDILSPEEIIELMSDQIVQLQDRTQYLEELQADMMEFTVALMGDLQGSDINLRKSTQKLRALETRAGREIFWLKSRRL